MRRGTILIIVVALLLLAAAGGGAYYYFVVRESPVNGEGAEPEDGDAGEARPQPRPPSQSQGDSESQQEETVTPEEVTIEVVVATVTIPAGTLVDNPNDFFEFQEFSQNDEALLGVNYITELGEIRGKVINTTISSGEPVDRNDLDRPGLSLEIPTPGPGDSPRKAYPLQVDRYSGVADLIRVGDVVDVVITMQYRGAPQPNPQDYRRRATKTIIQQAQVLRILRPPPPPPDDEDAAAAPAEAPPPSGAPPSGAPPSGAPASGTPQPAAPAEEPQDFAPAGQSSWFLILALTDQEIEYLEFVQSIRRGSDWTVPFNDTNAHITLVLRGSGDDEFESTQGASLDLLISELGLPLPSDLP